MKKFLFPLAIAATIGAASAALTDGADGNAPNASMLREQMKQYRATHPRQAGPQRVYGGFDADKPLYGMCDYAYDGPLYDYYGPARIDANGEHERLINGYIDSKAGCYFADGKYLSIQYDAGTTITSNITWAIYDAETWEYESGGEYVSTNTNVVASDLTYDPTTDRVYGVFHKLGEYGNPTTLAYVNFDNAFEPLVEIGTLPYKTIAIAADKDGNLYGVNTVSSSGTEPALLYKIDKYSAAVTTIGELSFDVPTMPAPSAGYQSAVVDWETGDMYLSLSDWYFETFIYRINLTDASTECLANFGYDSYGTGNTETFTGIYFKQQPAAAAAGTPADIADLTATPVGTDMKASLSFTMPTADTDGAPISGPLTYRVREQDADLATATAQPGEHVTIEIDVPGAPRATTFLVYAANGNAESHAASATTFIGPDTPVIASVSARKSGGHVALSWSEATSLNHGNLAPVTYSVVRTPGEEVVAEGITATNLNDTPASEIITEYTYLVTPLAGEIAGEAVASRQVWFGNYFALPLDEDFDSSNRFNQYPVIDANGDGNTWYYNSREEAAIYANGDTPADDYLCVGPFDIKAGTTYSISMLAGVHSHPEIFEVRYGNDPTDASSFTTVLVERTTFTDYQREFNASMTAAASELGYFAIRALSDQSMRNLYVYKFGVFAVTNDMPAAPTDIVQVPLRKGATIECELPDTTISGAPAALTAVRVYLDGNLLDEVTEGVADGAHFSYTDTEGSTDGDHIYTVRAVNAAGEGQAASLNAYLGLDYPGMPGNFRIYEDLDTPNLMHFTWEAPTKGLHGGYIDPENISYKLDLTCYTVSEANGEVDAGRGTSYSIQLPAPARESTLAANLWGENEKGRYNYISQMCATSSATFGPLTELPIYESWPDGGQSGTTPWTGQRIDEDQELFESWTATCNGAAVDKTAQDGDNGMMSFNTEKAGSGYALRSPRFSVAGTTAPALSFYVNFMPQAAFLKVMVMADNEPETEVLHINASESTNTWTRYNVSLAPYTSCKRLQVRFISRSNEPSECFTLLDNVSIADTRNADISANKFTGPLTVEVNATAEFLLTLRNNTANAVAADSYSVVLYKNGREASTFAGVNLGPDASAVMPLYDTPNVTDPEQSTYYAKVVFAADEAPDNNTSDAVEIHVIPTIYPRVQNLTGTSDNGVTLTWSEPDADDIPYTPTTDSFETYDDFAINSFGSWTCIDGDGQPTLTPATFFGPLTYPHVGEPMAWQVIEPVQAGFFSWFARTGEKFIASPQACIAGTREIDSDDWLISPELIGRAQTISFYASAGQSTYTPEVIDVLYSTSGNNVADFTGVAEANIEISSTSWGEYSFDLPEGTRYFAIVHKSYNKFAVLIDDITYTPATATAEQIELQGYNVYRDGERLNTEPLGESEYVDVTAVEGTTYTYHVTAQWNKGESAVSNAVTIVAGSTAIDSVESAAVAITTGRRTIRIEGAEGMPVSVFTPDGRCIFSVKAGTCEEIPVAAEGVYIVKAGATSAKVVVK